MPERFSPFPPNATRPKPASLLLTVSLAIGLMALTLAVPAAPPRDAQAVPHLNTRGQEGYSQFLAAEAHRAFAIAPGGGWGWSQGLESEDAALNQALEACQAHTRQRCVPYAVDSKVVFDSKGWHRLWRPYATQGEAKQIPAGTAPGLRFPNLVFKAPDGRTLKLSSLRGKVVVLHFWGTWCPTCRHELPQFERLQRHLAHRRDIAYLYTQVREPAHVARRWLQREGLNLPLHDSGVQGRLDDALHLAGGKTIKDRHIAPVFPATYVLDRHGVVVFSLRGSAEDWSQYAPFIEDLLSHRK